MIRMKQVSGSSFLLSSYADVPPDYQRGDDDCWRNPCDPSWYHAQIIAVHYSNRSYSGYGARKHIRQMSRDATRSRLGAQPVEIEISPAQSKRDESENGEWNPLRVA